MKILVVDDDLHIQRLYKEEFEDEGYEVVVASNGQEAIEAFESGGHELIFMDIQMPVMDGIEALRRIREMEAAGRRSVPVIAVTAHAMDEDRKAFLAEGFDGYIAKPARLRELFDEVERCRPRRLASPDQLR